MPDPDTWPALLAETVTLIRERLHDNDDTVEVSLILNELMVRREYDVYTTTGNVVKDRGEEYALTAGEVAYLTGTALKMLYGTGEVRQLGGGSHHQTVKILFEHLGWEELAKHDYQMDGIIAATPIRAAMANIPATGEIRWTQVRLLIEQSIVALRSNLPVLALVGARIATEEAIRRALQDVGHAPEEIEQLRAAVKREQKLFDYYLTSAGVFAPIDREATKAALSAIRDAGNDAAHTGEAADAYTNELLVHGATRAIASLSAAVNAHL